MAAICRSVKTPGRMRKGMSNLLLRQEYQWQEPDGAYGYTRFCVLYREWVKKQRRSMRNRLNIIVMMQEYSHSIRSGG